MHRQSVLQRNRVAPKRLAKGRKRGVSTYRNLHGFNDRLIFAAEFSATSVRRRKSRHHTIAANVSSATIFDREAQRTGARNGRAI